MGNEGMKAERNIHSQIKFENESMRETELTVTGDSTC
jgi:hypothetical protein